MRQTKKKTDARAKTAKKKLWNSAADEHDAQMKMELELLCSKDQESNKLVDFCGASYVDTCSHTPPPTCWHMLIVCRLDSHSQSRWSYHEINCEGCVQRLFSGHQFLGGQGTCWRRHRATGALKSLIYQQFTCTSNIKIYFKKYSENLCFLLF